EVALRHKGARARGESGVAQAGQVIDTCGSLVVRSTVGGHFAEFQEAHMSPGSSSVAVIVGAESETAQQLLAAAASECRSAGVNVSGVVAESHGLPDRSCSAGVLRDLVSGRAHPTYLETAPTGTSCH